MVNYETFPSLEISEFNNVIRGSYSYMAAEDNTRQRGQSVWAFRYPMQMVKISPAGQWSRPIIFCDHDFIAH